MSACVDCKFSAMEPVRETGNEPQHVRVCRYYPPQLPIPEAVNHIRNAFNHSIGLDRIVSLHRATFPIVTDTMVCGKWESV